MNYLFKQRIVIGKAPVRRHVVLVATHDPILQRLYLRHLEDEFAVISIESHKNLILDLAKHKPDVLVINTDSPHVSESDLVNFMGLLPTLRIITSGLTADEATMRRFLAAGVSSHINRTLTRPQDLLVIVKQVLGLT